MEPWIQGDLTPTRGHGQESLDPLEGSQDFTHDEVAIRLRKAFQGEEEGPVALDSEAIVTRENFEAEGGTSVLPPPYQVPQ